MAVPMDLRLDLPPQDVLHGPIAMQPQQLDTQIVKYVLDNLDLRHDVGGLEAAVSVAVRLTWRTPERSKYINTEPCNWSTPWPAHNLGLGAGIHRGRRRRSAKLTRARRGSGRPSIGVLEALQLAGSAHNLGLGAGRRLAECVARATVAKGRNS